MRKQDKVILEKLKKAQKIKDRENIIRKLMMNTRYGRLA